MTARCDYGRRLAGTGEAGGVRDAIQTHSKIQGHTFQARSIFSGRFYMSFSSTHDAQIHHVVALIVCLVKC